MPNTKQVDSDFQKGAVKGEGVDQTSLHGQLGHRDEDDLIKDSDSDFPEPGSNEEHSGERQR
jgi:hypothetical protein